LRYRRRSATNGRALVFPIPFLSPPHPHPHPLPATINWQYRPGAYYVFVDDFLTSAGDGPQQFTLTINAP